MKETYNTRVIAREDGGLVPVNELSKRNHAAALLH